MSSETGGRRDHVLLRDPALDEPVGERELEGANPAVGGEIGVEDDNPVVRVRELDERLPVRLDDILARRLLEQRAGATLGLTFE